MLPIKGGGVPIRRNRRVEPFGITAGNMQARPEWRDHVDAVAMTQFVRKMHEVGTGDHVGGEMRLAHYLLHTAVSEQFAISDVSDFVTAFRLVHVMGRDQYRQPLPGQ